MSTKDVWARTDAEIDARVAAEEALEVAIKGRDIDLVEIATSEAARAGLKRGALIDAAKRRVKRLEEERKANLVESVSKRLVEGLQMFHDALVLPVRSESTTADAKEEEEEEEGESNSDRKKRLDTLSKALHFISTSDAAFHNDVIHRAKLIIATVVTEDSSAVGSTGSNILREEMRRVDAERKKQRSDESKARLMNIVSKRCSKSLVECQIDMLDASLAFASDDEAAQRLWQDAADALHPLHAYEAMERADERIKMERVVRYRMKALIWSTNPADLRICLADARRLGLKDAESPMMRRVQERYLAVCAANKRRREYRAKLERAIEDVGLRKGAVTTEHVRSLAELVRGAESAGVDEELITRANEEIRIASLF
eukprot:g2056.t1